MTSDDNREGGNKWPKIDCIVVEQPQLNSNTIVLKVCLFKVSFELAGTPQQLKPITAGP